VGVKDERGQENALPREVGESEKANVICNRKGQRRTPAKKTEAGEQYIHGDVRKLYSRRRRQGASTWKQGTMKKSRTESFEEKGRNPARKNSNHRVCLSRNKL